MSRTAPVAYDSADRLIGVGYDVLVAPLLRVEHLHSPLDLTGVGSMIFTSRNGVTAFVHCSSERRPPAFTVGDATAKAAREAGFRQVLSAGGDVEDLRRLVLDKARFEDGVVLRAGAQEPAGDLVAALARGGLGVRDWPAYRTIKENPRAILDQINAPQRDLDAALIYSPKAARILSGLLTKQPLPVRTIVCISPAAAAELADHSAYAIYVAERPNENSLFAALQTASRSWFT